MFLLPDQVFRRLIEEGFNHGDFEVVDELVASGFVEHQNQGPTWPAGRDAVKATITSLRTAFPDLTLSIEDIVSDGDTVWGRIVATGTNTGPFMGFSPTGSPVRVDVIDIARVVGGLMVEHWGVADRLGVLLQLGHAPRRPD